MNEVSHFSPLVCLFFPSFFFFFFFIVVFFFSHPPRFSFFSFQLCCPSIHEESIKHPDRIFDKKKRKKNIVDYILKKGGGQILKEPLENLSE